MRHFVYFSGSAQTSGKALSQGNLMKAGRIDIAIHVIINAFFLSHKLRDNVKVHLIFYGMPDPPKHIEIEVRPETELSKKDVGTLLKKILYKYREGQKHEVLPGCFVEKKSFEKVLSELERDNEIFILDERGEDLRKVKIPENCVFVLGDQDGLPKKEMKRFRKRFTLVSVGKKIYFASQVVTIVNHELDVRGIG